MNALLRPIGRALGQMDDPDFVGVLWRSVLWSAIAFALVALLSVWGGRHLAGALGGAGLGWLAGIVAGIGAVVLAFWLFLPVAAAIGTLFIERIARAVERRFYPALPQSDGAPLAAQAWDGLEVGLRILVLQVGALILAILLPGAGLVLGWAIAAYAIGRGLFVAVAMRRMSRAEAESTYRDQRGVVLFQGGIIALAAYLPLCNLLIPVIGTAAMVHVLDAALARSDGRVALPGSAC
jgi:uncharacterized protein involved in cysteine biosynthesis